MLRHSLVNQSIGLAARLAFSTLVAYPFYWVNRMLSIHLPWNSFLIIAVILSALPTAWLWQRLPRFPAWVWKCLIFAALAILPLLAAPSVVDAHRMTAAGYAITLVVLWGIGIVYEQPQAPFKLIMITLGVGGGLLLANVMAGPVLENLRKRDEPPKPPAIVQSDPTAIPEASTPEMSVPTATTEPEVPTATSEITVTPAPTQTPAPTATPEPARPIAGYGYTEFEVDNGQAPWSNLTGYGPRVNSVMHAYMYNADGQIVYDNRIAFNNVGMRGPDVEYEKPDDVYRILVIGDSFVEAAQVPDGQTFYQLLQQELDQYSTPERRYEVLAMGRVGWGTIQEYIYYTAEGRKFDADLVILLFYINDVADNYPRFFYPNTNNTNFEFIFDDDGNARTVDTNQQPLPPNLPRRLYNALPDWTRNTNLAKLYIRLGDPPQPVLTPGGILTRVHPQFYIYVTDPEPEGYAEAWERTERTLGLFANRVNNAGAQFAVVPVFIGAEMVQNVSQWFPELVAGWQWDDNLPDEKLAEILDDLPADLVLTRPAFEQYAQSVNGQVYNLIFVQEDGHFNALGHQLTEQVIFDYLEREGIVNR